MSRRSEEAKARIAVWLGQRASRDTGRIDRVCRALLQRLTALPPETDFMRDDWIDSDRGFDAEELDRYQRDEPSATTGR